MISNLWKTFTESPVGLWLQGTPYGQWVMIVGVLALMGTFVGGVSSWIGGGNRGLKEFFGVIRRGITDLLLVTPRRILALATLTARESIRRKALWVGAVFLILFMFAGWFIGDSSEAAPAKLYISFVMTTIRWMLLPVTVLLACWGLPADIKDRSLHTVVTKPVRRSEVVLGRILGYVFVVSLLLLVVSAVGYAWVLRVVPARSQRQLISRVPLYGGLGMLNDKGERTEIKDGHEVEFQGINVGDLLDYRRFISGGTKERAIWEFPGVNAADFPGEEDVRLEYTFEAFRSYKGDINTEIEFSVFLVNEKTKLRVPAGVFPVNEFSSEVVHDLVKTVDETDEDGKKTTKTIVKTENLISIPRTVGYTDGGVAKTADLFKDLVNQGVIRIEIACLDSQQYLGVHQSDLFLRLPDRSFAAGYWKSIFVTWLLLVLVVTIATTSSCILKGPVATLATSGLLVLGGFFKEDLIDRLGKYYFRTGEVVGGGSVEAFYRIVTGMNQSSPLDESLSKRVIEKLDAGVYAMLYLAQNIIPDLRYFDAGFYTSTGFDVPWATCILPSLVVTLGFFIPAYIIGYFGLQVRELEAK